MDEELNRCEKLVIAIIRQCLKDLVATRGSGYTKQSCREAFDFFFNETSVMHRSFKEWCDISGLSSAYWQKMAYMHLAAALEKTPFLRYRVSRYMHGRRNYLILGKCMRHLPKLKKIDMLGDGTDD